MNYEWAQSAENPVIAGLTRNPLPMALRYSGNDREKQ
jgi:hypothetical protein